MRLHDLKPAPGSHRDRKRLGRGNASGQGTTAGKGTKGQKARSGGTKNGFRGMSSRNQRTAKRRGFTNIFKTQFEVVNVERLKHFTDDAVVNPSSLVEAGLIRGKSGNVKVLGNGDLEVRLRLAGVHVSAGARQKIAAASGSIEAEPDAVAEESSDASSGS
ncbi:MAG: 50S ribosomal protein L15 [Chloroflexota bacterium]